jgi:glyoxylase-like metal-dependent hydrolase (beta-lactamase superfamily II)
MVSKIKKFRIGFTNVYLLLEKGKALMVDTGGRGEVKKLQKAIKSAGLSSNDLKYIFLTHTHYDHTGSTANLKDLTGAQVIVHKSEAENLIHGFKPIPKGTSPFFKFISKAGKFKKSIELKVGKYPPVKPDITFDNRLSLKQYGFDAEIRHIPGHTIGSSGVVVGDKAIVGDCMFNMQGSIYPGFADDEEKLANTWKMILEWDVNWFYPSHGKRFSKEEFVMAAVKKGIK